MQVAPSPLLRLGAPPCPAPARNRRARLPNKAKAARARMYPRPDRRPQGTQPLVRRRGRLPWHAKDSTGRCPPGPRPKLGAVRGDFKLAASSRKSTIRAPPARSVALRPSVSSPAWQRHTHPARLRHTADAAAHRQLRQHNSSEAAHLLPCLATQHTGRRVRRTPAHACANNFSSALLCFPSMRSILSTAARPGGSLGWMPTLTAKEASSSAAGAAPRLVRSFNSSAAPPYCAPRTAPALPHGATRLATGLSDR